MFMQSMETRKRIRYRNRNRHRTEPNRTVPNRTAPKSWVGEICKAFNIHLNKTFDMCVPHYHLVESKQFCFGQQSMAVGDWGGGVPHFWANAKICCCSSLKLPAFQLKFEASKQKRCSVFDLFAVIK